jgi:hypothetical protein
VGVNALVGVLIGEGVITKNVGELFKCAGLLVAVVDILGVGVAEPGLMVGAGEGAGIRGFCEA